MSRRILERMADPTVVALAADGSEWPRALVSETLIPDKWMGLVQRPDGGRRFVPSGEDPRPERGERLVLVRNRPITVPLSVADVRASCGHAVTATCELLLSWQSRDDDLAALARSLLESGALSLDGLARAVVNGGGRTALQHFIRENAATKLVHEDSSDEFTNRLRDELKRFLFSSGATLERIATLRFTSASLAADEALVRETAATVERIKAREMVQQASLAAAQRRLEGLSGIFEQLNAAAAGDQRRQWHDLLPALTPADRGRLLENLWRITPDASRAVAIALVAGQECLWLDPADLMQVSRRTALDDTLGGLRSVSFCQQKNWLLIGAARGVWALAADTGETRVRFEVPPGPSPRTGFNAAAIVGERLFATHSQLGCWNWTLAEPHEARCLMPVAPGGPKTMRAVVDAADGSVLFAADRAVHRYEPVSGTLTSLGDVGDVIHAVAVLDNLLFVGTADGRILHRTLDPTSEWTLWHRGRATIESIHARRWNDLVELVVPAGPDGVSGVYGEENMVVRLLRAGPPIRRAWASDDVVVGLTEQRDRLIVLSANRPERTGVEVPIARMTGHSVQDACLVTARVAPPPGASGVAT